MLNDKEKIELFNQFEDKTLDDYDRVLLNSLKGDGYIMDYQTYKGALFYIDWDSFKRTYFNDELTRF